MLLLCCVWIYYSSDMFVWNWLTVSRRPAVRDGHALIHRSHRRVSKGTSISSLFEMSTRQVGLARPMTTIGYYVQIPAGRPVHNTSLIGSDYSNILPTLPPGTSKNLIFDGSSYLRYDLERLPSAYRRTNNDEKFYVKFKTDEPNSLLWYCGTKHENAFLCVKV